MTKVERIIGAFEPGTLFRARLFDDDGSNPWSAVHRWTGTAVVRRLTAWANEQTGEVLGSDGGEYPLSGMWADRLGPIELIRLPFDSEPAIEMLRMHGLHFKAALAEGLVGELLT